MPAEVTKVREVNKFVAINNNISFMMERHHLDFVSLLLLWQGILLIKHFTVILLLVHPVSLMHKNLQRCKN